MSYFQIKISEGARREMDDESKEFMADLGWYEEDLDIWLVVNATVAEDYFDLDSGVIAGAITEYAVAGEPCKLIMCFDEVGESKESLIVEFVVREVPALIRQGNSDKGFIVSDDIAFQMEREMRFIAEELIPPNGGEACNWFRGELSRHFENKVSN